MKKLKALWSRRPRMSRKAKLLQNLALCLLFLFLSWMAFDFPLPTKEMAFRRAEAAHLMERSEILGQMEKGRWTYFISEYDGRLMVSRLTGKRAGTEMHIQFYDREGLMYFSVDDDYSFGGGDGGFLVLDGAPWEAVSLEFDLLLDDLDGPETPYPDFCWSGTAQREENGLFYLTIPVQENLNTGRILEYFLGQINSDHWNAVLQVRFFDAAGALIGQTAVPRAAPD